MDIPSMSTALRWQEQNNTHLNIEKGVIVFDNLTAGTYTLYYLYDGWNLSEGMVTVEVK